MGPCPRCCGRWGGGIARTYSFQGLVEEHPRRSPPPLLLPGWFPGASALCKRANVPTLGVLEAWCWVEAEAGGSGGAPLIGFGGPACPRSWPVSRQQHNSVWITLELMELSEGPGCNSD